jgi:hypothetical protein
MNKVKRYDWLCAMINKNNYSVGAEIGCAKGSTTRVLLARNPDLKLYAVDLWSVIPEGNAKDDTYDTWKFEPLKQTFNSVTKPYRNRMTILKGISWEMAGKVADKSLDFIFIDAGHDAESVKKDIIAWTPKVKDGGLISGHDFNLEGVAQALKELIPTYRIGTEYDHVWFAEKEEVLC